MDIIRTVTQMQAFTTGRRKNGKSVGLVPTMGALHQGHLSLLALARENADVTVLSIFVNPTQFGPREDLAKYPRPFDEDVRLAAQHGCDAVFAPADVEMYPEGYQTFVEVGAITELLCGASRPGHFRGVATVVCKLFNAVQPDCAVFGHKDAQQALVIRRMTADLNMPVRIIVAPTVREADGLAMSSRNRYLSRDERAAACCLYQGLVDASDRFAKGERASAPLKRLVADTIGSTGLLDVEYIEIVDTPSFRPVETIAEKALLAIAVRTKQTATRLIDNIMLGGTL